MSYLINKVNYTLELKASMYGKFILKHSFLSIPLNWALRHGPQVGMTLRIKYMIVDCVTFGLFEVIYYCTRLYIFTFVFICRWSYCSYWSLKSRNISKVCQLLMCTLAGILSQLQSYITYVATKALVELRSLCSFKLM